METAPSTGRPCEVVGEFEMMAETVKEVDEGMEVVELVKKVSIGWRVDWSEERYTREEESEETLIMDKDEVRIYVETQVTLDC